MRALGYPRHSAAAAAAYRNRRCCCRVAIMTVIEWNAHLFHADVTRFPFHPRASYRPDVSPGSGAGGWSVDHPTAEVSDDYAQSLRARGIDRCVVVHPEPYGDDHSVILDVLDRHPEWLGTSLFYPRESDAVSKLEVLVAQQPRIISTRFHAHRGVAGFQAIAGGEFPKGNEYFDSFNDPCVRALWGRAVELGLIIELHIGPNYGKEVAACLRDMPASIVLIDHLAEPHMGDGVEFTDILELAAFPNVFMKLSGLGHFADDAPLFESARPFTQRVIDAFGPDRMIWCVHIYLNALWSVCLNITHPRSSTVRALTGTCAR